MNVYRIHLRPGGADHLKSALNHQNAVNYCLKNNVLGVGWSVGKKDKPISFEEYIKEARQVKDERYKEKNLESVEKLREVEKGDFIWAYHSLERANRCYYLGKVVSGWEYLSSDEAREADIVNVVHCNLVEVPKNRVPEEAIKSFIPPKAFQEVKGIADETESLWKGLWKDTHKDALRELIQHVLDSPILEGITYEELAKRIGRENKHGKPQAHGMGKVLEKMGHFLEKVEGKWDEWNEPIPVIQSLVVNKGTGLPSDGIKKFWKSFPLLNEKEKQDQVWAEYEKIQEFGSRWNRVLSALDIPSVRKSEPLSKSTHQSGGGGGGESPEHIALKEYVQSAPGLVGLNAKPEAAIAEYSFPSSDRVDVLFKYRGQWVAVEVKSRISDSVEGDYERGIYQCIKYRALLEAMKQDNKYNVPEKVRAVLLLEKQLPKALKLKAKRLNVEVVEGVKVPKKWYKQ